MRMMLPELSLSTGPVVKNTETDRGGERLVSRSLPVGLARPQTIKMCCALPSISKNFRAMFKKSVFK